MQDQPNGPDVGVADEQAEREVLALLLGSELPGPWSAQAVGLESGSEWPRMP